MERMLDDPQWVEVMRLENECDCYVCGEPIPAGTLPLPMQADGYGFTWGSDGCFPDGASAMYACFGCRAHWNDNTEDDEDEDV